MKRHIELKRSILHQYIATYVSLILISCGVLFLFSTYSTARQLNREIAEHQQYQLTLLAEDMDFRYNEMEEIVFDIAVSSAFKPYFLSRSAFYEIDVLSALSKYTGRSLLSDRVVLTYNDSDAVFTDSAKYSSAIFLSSVLKARQGKALWETIQKTREFTIIDDETCPEGMQIWCFPTRIIGVSAAANPARVLFLVSDDAYRENFERIVGSIPGNIDVYFGEQMIQSVLTCDRFDEKHSFTAASSSGHFVLNMLPESSSAYDNSLFGFGHFGIFFVWIVAMIVVGVFLAFRNYSPIQRVYEKQNPTRASDSAEASSDGMGNELEQLENTLDRYATEHRQDSLRLQEQFRILRRQVLQRLINGYPFNAKEDISGDLGIVLPHCTYFVVMVLSDAGVEATEVALTEICRELSGDECACYATISDNSDSVLMLFNVPRSEQRKELVEALLAQCEQHRLNVVCGVGLPVTQREQLRICIMEALSAINAAQNTSVLYYEDIRTHKAETELQISDLNALTSALRSGDAAQAEACLVQLLQQIQSSTQSIPLQLYLCSKILNELIQFANQMNLPFQPEQMGWLYSSTSVNGYRDGLIELVWEIADACFNREDNSDEEYANRIVRFVDENYLNYTMSLDMLAEHFSISVSNLSRLFKNATGESFKDYVIRKRIAEAKRLILTEDILVSELCARIGYTNVSHFIKVFKSQVGYTPAAFKKTMHERP